ncbi:nickel pincer cofactor biosynthesis protein LarB [Cohnella silvisoli]|uniref:Nickel pincer cofactor biosynthesis protein LarB n=1 Tax=Cohnella silvisoli TaxID=2873699 RepID=A0ABV1L467_9BACL|nr:nickel pincer cofactor biosynthesis protein LarB [Cohnella silvisoli]MCD9026165.1 nickel pincer cofactor biosynthesis protein LarB [Cohnella silvisoli]
MSTFEDMGFCKLDTDREQRTGNPEVIFGQGKTVEQALAIFGRLAQVHGRALLTRASAEMAERICAVFPEASHVEEARLVRLGAPPAVFSGTVLVLCGGTGDIPVAEEAACTAEWMGCAVQRIYDVGVAGIDRLLSYRQQIQEANVIIVVAGMEGALASVVGGMVRRPVIAVPTSVGYGAHLHGVTPMLAMMTSCAAGVSVVNIDNGFGAGYNAAAIQRLLFEKTSLP